VIIFSDITNKIYCQKEIIARCKALGLLHRHITSKLSNRSQKMTLLSYHQQGRKFR